MTHLRNTCWIAILMALAGAPPVLADATSLMIQAEAAFRRDDLHGAEVLYRKALERNEPGTVTTCYERLLAIYVRGDRHDRAIATGKAMRTRFRDDPAALRRIEWQLGCSYLELGHMATAREHLESAVREGPSPLSVELQLDALFRLARIAIRTQADPAPFWQAFDRLEARLSTGSAPDEKRASIQVHRMLADADVARGRSNSALQRLTALEAIHRDLEDWPGLAETLLRKARAREPSDPKVESDLLAADAQLNRVPGRAPLLLRGDLSTALMAWYRGVKKETEAVQWQETAARVYLQLLQNPQFGPEGLSATLTAYWRLQGLYRSTRQLDEAHRLSLRQEDDWGIDHLLESRWKVHHGALSLQLHQYATALPALRDAVDLMQQQVPPDLHELPRAWLYLAHIEQIQGDPLKAAGLAKKCLELYSAHKLPRDALQVEAHAVQGMMLCLQGQFAQAIDTLNAGRALSRGLEEADVLDNLLLLNLATVHMAQGDIEQALQMCQEAHTKFRDADPDASAHVAFEAALATMYLARSDFERGDLQQAGAYADRILAARDKGSVSPAYLVTALHCRGLLDMQENRVDQAEARWQQAREIQEASGDRALLSRTYNCLGLVWECRRDKSRAERLQAAAAWYQKAYDLQQGALEKQGRSSNLPQADERSTSFPAVRFITHWRLAAVLEALGRHAEAREKLRKGVEVADGTRRRTYGDAAHRARYFAQFTDGIQSLVEWSLRDADWDAAVGAIALSRGRTLEDQMLLAGADPRAGLPNAQERLALEATLQNQLSALRLQALLLNKEQAESKDGTDLWKRFQDVQQELTKIQNQIQTDSPLYRGLAAEQSAKLDLADVRQALRSDKQVILQYVIGDHASWLLIVPGGDAAPTAYPLTIEEAISTGLKAPRPVSSAERIAMKKQDIVGNPTGPSKKATLQTHSPLVPLNAPVLRALVAQYLARLANPRQQMTRAVRIVATSDSNPLTDERSAALGNALLPEAAVKRIEELHPDLAVIIPDGPLHKLPIETLMVGDGEQARFAVDVLPATVYALSLGVLVRSQKQGGWELGELKSLVTVADPAYSDQTFGGQWLKGFPRLEGTATESKTIQSLFVNKQVIALQQQEATEARLVASLAGRQVVHIAGHGFADPRSANQFAALALAPPTRVTTSTDDGFLCAHEICRLQLPDCELAVLSSCDTNVGEAGPLEAGVTLANSFLVAGAQRVVASHWPVSDSATVLLMETFFKELASNDPLRRHPARALQTARRAVRLEASAHPFYWGAFTLTGRTD